MRGGLDVDTAGLRAVSPKQSWPQLLISGLRQEDAVGGQQIPLVSATSSLSVWKISLIYKDRMKREQGKKHTIDS